MVVLVTHERPYYLDRTEAGRQLAVRLGGYQGNCVVFGVPKGGMPVAAEIARRLGADLDAVVVRKLPIPFNPEAGYGAMANDGLPVYNRPLVKRIGLNDREVQKQAERARADLNRRTALYRGDKPFPWLVGKVAIVADDGLASGYTMAAAIRSVRAHRAGKVVAVAPVASASAYEIVKSFADEVVCPIVSKSSWFSVAGFYEQWNELTDDEALSLLRNYSRQALSGAARR